MYLEKVLKGDNKLAKLAALYSLKNYINEGPNNILFEDYIDLIFEEV